jgi:hypothetical protein
MENELNFNSANKESVYQPTVADEACQDALKLGGEDEQSLRRIDPLLWARGKIASLDCRYAGQVDKDELLEYFIKKGQYEWDADTVANIKHLFEELPGLFEKAS